MPFLLVAALIAGCGTPEPIPPSGVQGPIILHQWRNDGRPPLVVVAHQLIQGDAGLTRLELEAVLVRMPFEPGTLFIAAPRAEYEAAGDKVRVRLHGDDRARLKISGEKGGEPLIGTAEESWYDGTEGALYLTKVELYSGGLRQRYERVRVVKDIAYDVQGRTIGDRPPPGLHAVLAALPRPLRYPEFRRGDFSE